MAILAQLVDDVVVHKFEITQEQLQIGRHPTNDVVVDDLVRATSCGSAAKARGKAVGLTE